MAWFTRNSRVGNDMGDLFSPGGDSPSYTSDNFARNSFGVQPISASDYRVNTPQDDYFARMRKMAEDPTPSMDAYRSALSQAPQAEDYRPTWATRIAAGLGGISAGMKDAGEGVKVAATTNRLPYMNALSDYKAHIDPLEAAAKIESEDQDSKMKYYQQAAQLDNTRFANNTTRARDIETANWHNRTAGDTEKFQGWQMQSGDKRLNAEISNYGSLADWRKNSTANQRFSNQTAREGMLNQNANTLDANINAARANDIRDWAAHNPRVTPPTAGGLSSAEQDVLAEMHQTHPGFVIPDPQDPSRYVISPPPRVTSPEYIQWKANRDDMLGRINRRARGTADFGVPGGSPDNPYEVTPAGEEEQ